MPEYLDYGDIESFELPNQYEPSFTYPDSKTILKYVMLSVIVIILLLAFLVPISSVVNEATASDGALASVAPWGVSILQLIGGILITGIIVVVTKSIFGKRYNDDYYY